MRGLLVLFAIVFGMLAITISVANSTKTTTYQNVKIQDKQQQQLIKGSGNDMRTEIRYLVITDKGTFVCESNLLQGKFNNSDLFWRLKVDSTYSEIKVSGFGKGFLFDYQNLMEIK